MSTSNQQTLTDSGANERPSMLEKGNYIPWESRPMIPNPDKPTEQILEPLSKMIEGNKKQYIADVRVMNYLFQAIPNDIYNSVDAYKNAKDMWEQIKSVNQNQVSQLLATLMEQICYYASKAKKATKNHDPLALLAHLNASLSQSHANSSYSQQLYYVTHPSPVASYEDEYQGELQGDSQEDKLTTDVMLLAGAITKKNAGRQNRNQAFNPGTGNDESNQIVHLAVFSSRFTMLATSSPCSSPICSISVSPSLFVLSVSAPVSASAGDGDS
ncbi:hypothetical protein Tco_1541309 [Tanacetum coccineum]